MKIHYATISKVGHRSNNEDAFKVVEQAGNHRWMGIVCDGMGGHAMGEVASETVANSISAYWEREIDMPDSKEKVYAACREASKAVDKRADSLIHVEMGTTMVMASIENETATIAHVGDSRCYLQRPDEGIIYQTKDHIGLSFGWEVVTRCFFSYRQEVTIPDVGCFKLKTGDRILLCSDGIYKSMAPDILQARMMDDKRPEEILDVFDFLCEKSGDDNYTGIMIYID